MDFRFRGKSGHANISAMTEFDHLCHSTINFAVMHSSVSA
jgi:hypothetical protein